MDKEIICNIPKFSLFSCMKYSKEVFASMVKVAQLIHSTLDKHRLIEIGIVSFYEYCNVDVMPHGLNHFIHIIHC